MGLYFSDLRSSPLMAQRATRRLSSIRCQLERALEQLSDQDGLTQAGGRLTEQLRRTVSGLLEEPIPREVDRQSKAELVELESRWQGAMR
jgi:hypothetical protein